jgi:flagellar hook-associated protein 2
MADLSVGGLATGIDTASLIQKLMELEQQPQKVLQSKVTAAQSKISIFNQISSAMSSLETAVKEMNTPTAFISRASALTDSSVATATVDSTAQPDTHTILVDSLAQFQRQISDTTYASAADLNFSTGTITIGKSGSPDTPVSIAIGEGQNSLTGIAAAINGSGANVSASLINDGTGYRLILTGKDTNNYAVDTTGLTTAPVSPTGAAYAAPTFAGGIGYLEGRPASFTVDGIAMTRTSNSISDVIPGVTFNLLKDGASSTKLTVSTDISGVTAKINGFVSAYNSAMTLLSKQSSYNSTTKSAGALAGDSTVRDIKKQLQSVISNAVAGVDDNFSGLSSIGISTNYQDGTLKVDATKLAKSLNTHFDAVADLFTHNSGKKNLAANEYGIAQQFTTQLGKITHIYEGDTSSNNGKIASRIKGLNDLISDTNKRIAVMDDQLARKQAQLKKQYAAMESLVSSIQSSGNKLLAALDSYTTSTKSSSS